MRVVLAVAVFAALIGAVVASDVEVEAAGEGAAETQAEVEHPVLPALGSPCLPRRSRSRNWRVVSHRPRSFRGVCTTESACPTAQHEPGYCAGIGVVCCKQPQQPQPSTKVEADVVGAPATPAAAAAAAAAAASSPVATVPTGVVLKSGTSACQTQGGTCGTPAACSAKKGTTKSGLCPGSSTNICCFVKAATPTTPTTPTRPPTTPTTPSTPSTPTAPATTSLTQLIRIPSAINPGLTIAGAKGLTAKIGQPGCPLTTKCFDCNCAISNTRITRNRVTMLVTDKVRITGLRPFVEAVARAFAAIKAAGATNPLLKRVYDEVKTAGGLCCRPIKRSNGSAGGTWSNHSWGAAVDFYFGNTIDPRGDGKCQYGLSLMAPFFAKEKLYWAAGYRGSEEDAMHFEASQQALNAWPAL